MIISKQTFTPTQNFGAVPLSELAPKVEAELGKKAAKGGNNAAKALFSQKKCLKKLDKASLDAQICKDWELVQQSRSGEGNAQRGAQETLLTQCANVISHQAKIYSGCGLDYDDLQQEGRIGATLATRRYNHKKGATYKGYAFWWIRKEILLALAEKGRMIGVPVPVVDGITKYRKLIARAQLLDETLSDDELKKAMKVSQKTLDRIRHSDTREPLSLDKPVGDDKEEVLAALVRNKKAVDPCAECLKAERRKHLSQKLIDLVGVEKARILELSFGMVDGIEYSIEEIAEMTGRPKTKIVDLKKTALVKLRKSKSVSLRQLLQESKEM